MENEKADMRKLNVTVQCSAVYNSSIILIGLLFAGNAEKNYCKRLTARYEAACAADMDML